MAITGTGSTTDPYIVSTWDELVTAAALTGNKNIRFIEGTVIDLGEVYSGYAPIVESSYNNSLTIDFNDAKIINGKFNGIFRTGDYSSSYYPLIIRNLIMLNCLNDHPEGIAPDNGQGEVRISRSVLDIHLPSPSSAFADSEGTDANTYITFYRCSVTVSGNGKLGEVIFEDSDVNINLVCNETYNPPGSLTYLKIGESSPRDFEGPVNHPHVVITDPASKLTLKNSHLSGKLKLPDGVTGSTCIYVESKESVIEVECDFVVLWSTSTLTLSNSELSVLPAKFIPDVSDKFIPAGPIYERNTSEIRNQQVLYDLGFSVNPNSIAA